MHVVVNLVFIHGLLARLDHGWEGVEGGVWCGGVGIVGCPSSAVPPVISPHPSATASGAVGSPPPECRRAVNPPGGRIVPVTECPAVGRWLWRRESGCGVRSDRRVGV